MSRNDRVYCVINPVRKHHHNVWQLVQHHCVALGYPPPTQLTTTIAAPGGLQAEQALQDGADTVIVAGGDGTVRNVGAVLAHTGVALGIIPIGTANIFHLNAIGKEKRLDQSVRTALMGADTAIDMGTVQLQFATETLDERFLVVVGVGRDALSLGGVSPRLKNAIGPAAYFASGMPHLMRSPLPMQVEVDGEALDIDAAWSVLVGNCGVVPGGITILPEANLQDGKLNLLHVAPRSVAGWLPVAWRGLRGSNRPTRGMIDHEIERVTIIPETPAAAQIDGDIWTDVHRITIAVDPAALIIRGKASYLHEPTGNHRRDQTPDSRVDQSER